MPTSELGVVEGRDPAYVEAGECRAEPLSLAQDREPGQTGLERLEADPLEHLRVAAQLPAPLGVVVGDVVG